jgi:hypothetical protein
VQMLSKIKGVGSLFQARVWPAQAEAHEFAVGVHVGNETLVRVGEPLVLPTGLQPTELEPSHRDDYPALVAVRSLALTSAAITRRLPPRGLPTKEEPMADRRQQLGGLIIWVMVALALAPISANGQGSGGDTPGKTWSCEGNVWVFNGVELGMLERGRLVLVLGGQTLPAGCYWYDTVSGMIGREGEGPAADLLAGLELGGPLRADASNGRSGIFLNGREITATEVENFTRLGATLMAGRYWMNPDGRGGREDKPASFQLSAGQDPTPAPLRSQSGESSDHLYQSGDTHGGVQGKCVFMSGPTFSYMGEGC